MVDIYRNKMSKTLSTSMKGRKLLRCSPFLYRSAKKEAPTLKERCRGHHAGSLPTVGLAVGRGNHHGPEVEEVAEEALEDHGVPNVRHLKLVQAEQPGLGAEGLRHGWNGVVLRGPAAQACLGGLLFPCVDAWSIRQTLGSFRRSLSPSRNALCIWLKDQELCR